MPIPLQPLITLPLYDRPNTYIMLSILEQMKTNESRQLYIHTQYQYSREGMECEAAARK